MTCVREPSDGDEVEGPFGIAVRFDMVVGKGGRCGGVWWWSGSYQSHLDPDHRHRRSQPETAEFDRMFCARQVFRCFKFVEKLGERVLGAVGPYFVAAAVGLISVGAVCFCKSGPPPTSARGSFVELLERVYQSKSYGQRYPTLGSRRQYAS